MSGKSRHAGMAIAEYEKELAKDKSFYGGFGRFAKGLAPFFFKKYSVSGIDKQNGPTVFICRHLDMHGCYTVMRSVDFDIHIMALNVFFDTKTAYRQYADITFAKGGKPSLNSRLKAVIPAIAIPRLFSSMQAIPAYRGGTEVYKTIKQTVRYLLRDECVLIFPDIDYKAKKQKESDIYKGFLLVEELYNKLCGAHINFVPLFIDEEQRAVLPGKPIAFTDGDIHAQLDTVADQIRQGINYRPAD